MMMHKRHSNHGALGDGAWSCELKLMLHRVCMIVELEWMAGDKSVLIDWCDGVIAGCA